jgi:hypothetical protein
MYQRHQNSKKRKKLEGDKVLLVPEKKKAHRALHCNDQEVKEFWQGAEKSTGINFVSDSQIEDDFVDFVVSLGGNSFDKRFIEAICSKEPVMVSAETPGLWIIPPKAEGDRIVKQE